MHKSWWISLGSVWFMSTWISLPCFPVKQGKRQQKQDKFYLFCMLCCLGLLVSTKVHIFSQFCSINKEMTAIQTKTVTLWKKSLSLKKLSTVTIAAITTLHFTALRSFKHSKYKLKLSKNDRQNQGDHSFPESIFHDFSMTKKWKSMTYRHNIFFQINDTRLTNAYENY